MRKGNFGLLKYKKSDPDLWMYRYLFYKYASVEYIILDFLLTHPIFSPVNLKE